MNLRRITDSHWPALIGGLVLSVLVNRRILFSSGYVEYGDFAFNTSISIIRDSHFYAWNGYLTSDNGVYLSLNAVYSWLLLLPTTWIVQRVMIILPFVLGFLFMYVYSFRISQKVLGRATSRLMSFSFGTLYMVNPWITGNGSTFGIISSWFLYWGYALVPLQFLVIETGLEHDGQHAWRRGLVLGLLFAITANPNGIVLGFGFAALYTVLRLALRGLHVVSNVFALWGGSLFSFALVSAYWEVPYLFYYGSSLVPYPIPNLFKIDQSIMASLVQNVNPLLILTLFYTFPALTYLSSTLPSFLSATTLVIVIVPALSVASLFSIRKNKDSLPYWGLLAVATFFGNGYGFPTGPIYLFLVTRAPLSNLAFIVDTPYKFMSYVVFFLIVLALRGALEAAKSMRVKVRFPSSKSLLPVGLAGLILLSSVTNAGPAYSGLPAQNLTPINPPYYYTDLQGFLATQPGVYRISWLPPYLPARWAPDAPPVSVWLSNSPIFSEGPGVVDVGPIPNKLFDYYIYRALMLSENATVSQLFSAESTKFIIFRNDTIGSDPSGIIIQNLPGIEKVRDIGALAVYENRGPLLLPTVSSGHILVVGGFDSMAPLLHLGTNLVNTPLVFIEQARYSQTDFLNLLRNASGLVFYGNKTVDDLTLDLFRNHIKVLDYASIEEGWKPDAFYSYSWTPSLASNPGVVFDFDLNAGFAVSDTPGQVIRIPIHESSSGTYQTWMRTFIGPKGGNVTVSVDGGPPLLVDTWMKANLGFKWVLTGQMPLQSGDHILTITNMAGTNAINLMTVATPSDLSRSKTEILDALSADGVPTGFLDNYQTLARTSTPGPVLFGSNQTWSLRSGEEMTETTYGGVYNIQGVANNQNELFSTYARFLSSDLTGYISLHLTLGFQNLPHGYLETAIFVYDSQGRYRVWYPNLTSGDSTLNIDLNKPDGPGGGLPIADLSEISEFAINIRATPGAQVNFTISNPVLMKEAPLGRSYPLTGTLMLAATFDGTDTGRLLVNGVQNENITSGVHMTIGPVPSDARITVSVPRGSRVTSLLLSNETFPRRDTGGGTVKSWTRSSDGAYAINVELTRDALLETPEAFSPFWRIDQYPKSSPLILNGITTGFLVSVGSYQLTIRFGPQAALAAGTIVSLVGFFVITFLVLWPYVTSFRRRVFNVA